MNNQNNILKKDLSTLGIGIEKLETVTAKDARIAYHKTAREVHPDKADPENLEQVKEYTAAFQEAGNAYQRILKHVIDRLQSQQMTMQSLPKKTSRNLIFFSRTEKVLLSKLKTALLRYGRSVVRLFMVNQG